MDGPSWRDEVEDLVDALVETLGELPYDPTPSELYEATGLYSVGSAHPFTGSIDQQVYQRARHPNLHVVRPAESLAQRLHDHGITVALDAFRRERHIVGVMGGHDLTRGCADYARVVELGAALARAGACVTTGGGPGAMEAANFGAAASSASEAERNGWMAELATAPSFADDPDRFVAVGLAVAAEIGEPVTNLAIPTWFYGHEPTNTFATAIAKYFGNSEREDALLAISTGGVVFVPGGPGTVQEIFQDAAQNAYETLGPPSPMVFLAPEDDPEYWHRNGVLGALDRVFLDPEGNRRPGWNLVGTVPNVAAAVAATRSGR